MLVNVKLKAMIQPNRGQISDYIGNHNNIYTCSVHLSLRGWIQVTIITPRTVIQIMVGD